MKDPQEMDAPCLCDCGEWFDQTDGYVSLFKQGTLICSNCHEKEETEEQYITVGVLGGAYKGKEPKNMLTHSVESWLDGGGEGFSLCGRIKADHLADSNSDPMGKGDRPTCKFCLKKDPRFN